MVEMEKSALIVLVGVLLCNVDALRYKPFDNLKVDPNLDLKYKLDDKKDQKEKNWHLGIEPSITNNYPGLKASLDYQKNNFRAGVDYKYQKTPFNDLHTVGGNIGYDNGKFHLQGRGHIDNTGNWGGGVGFGWRYKRSLRKPKPAFYLRVEADPCQFILYDRNGDNVITIEELEEVFPARNLADGLFERLDIEERGEITRKEFEVAKASGAIVGCVVPAYKERIPDEVELED